MNSLPPEILHCINSKLPISDVIRLGCTCTGLRLAAEDDALWRSHAFKKWGDQVNVAESMLGPALLGRWHLYVKHRSNFRQHRPTSPLGLVQEDPIFSDPWKHLACCLLCSRTSGSEGVRKAIKHILEKWPTASDIIRAVDLCQEGMKSESGAIVDFGKSHYRTLFSGQKQIEFFRFLRLLRPLGLEERRMEALKAMSVNFLVTAWEDPSEFYGCGQFCSDSWRIFCRGDLSGKGVQDKKLQKYVRWWQTGSTEEPPKETSQPGPRRKKAKTEVTAPASGRVLRSGLNT